METATETGTGTRYATTADGRRIYVDPDDVRGQRLVTSDGDLNPLSRVMWHRALRLHPWELVVDVGANYGEMLVGAPIPAGAEVLAFEPNLALHPHLTSTLADNHLVVDVRPEAVGDRAGRAGFAVDTTWSGKSTLRAAETYAGDERWRLAEVPVTTLDEVVGATPRTCCVKVDVEGHEGEVLAGATRIRGGTAPFALMLEVHHLPSSFLAELAGAHATYLMDRRTQRLIRIPGGNARLAERMRGSAWLYLQDCLVLSDDLDVAV